jgi:hypothetical protein
MAAMLVCLTIDLLGVSLDNFTGLETCTSGYALNPRVLAGKEKGSLSDPLLFTPKYKSIRNRIYVTKS